MGDPKSKKVKDLKLEIYIESSVEELFAYTLDSKNTPKWFTSIKEEIASETPVKLGTKLKNRGDDKNNWNLYEITEFEKNKTFTLSQIGGGYHVRYTFLENGPGTDFEYYEWVDEGELSEPTNMETLVLLKNNIEKIQ
jgi:uncharacterized protein YndB with AHSA1/START domain